MLGFSIWRGSLGVFALLVAALTAVAHVSIEWNEGIPLSFR